MNTWSIKLDLHRKLLKLSSLKSFNNKSDKLQPGVFPWQSLKVPFCPIFLCFVEYTRLQTGYFGSLKKSKSLQLHKMLSRPFFKRFTHRLIYSLQSKDSDFPLISEIFIQVHDFVPHITDLIHTKESALSLQFSLYWLFLKFYRSCCLSWENESAHKTAYAPEQFILITSI